MKIILTSLTTLFFFWANCQKLDSCIYRCKYYATFQNDTVSKNNIAKDLIVFEVGDNTSLFYSEYRRKGDSLFMEDEKKGYTFNDFSANRAKYYADKWSLVIFKNYISNKLLASEKIIESYKYEEPLQTQNWLIANDTITLNGLLCQKATCKFRGRDYEAWFTSSIPISKGIWKFDGLPGLIIRIKEKENRIRFDFISIEIVDKKFPIVFPEKKLISTKREELALMKKERDEDPIGFVEKYAGVVKVTSTNGVIISPAERKAKGKRHNPIEKE
jgi:GLPGLI family protein